MSGIAAGDPRIRLLVNETNLGHGRSVRRGLDEAIGDWLLHIDSDGQVALDEFPLLWDQRDRGDLILGVRTKRQDALHRRVLTRITRAFISVLARRRVRDPNTPFKLIRRQLYEHLRPIVPETAFAPSILIVLGAYRSKARVVNVATTHRPRQHGVSTLRLGRLAHAVLRSAGQTVRFSTTRVKPYG